jgi:O-succinylbenzoic acid--CoA ligase
VTAAMPEWLSQRARITPDKTAFVFDRLRISFADLDLRADAVAARLGAQGVAPGDFVAVLGHNSPGLVEAVFGVKRAGAVLVPVNSRLTPVEIGAQLKDCGARVLLASDETNADIELPQGSRVLPLDMGSAESAPLTPRPAAAIDPASIHSVIYTSGTTGAPKGAMLSWANFFWNAAGSAFNLGLRDDDCWLVCMPLFHVGGLSILVRGVLYGMTVEVHEAFDPDRVNEALCSGRVTIVSLVPTMLQRMIERQRGGYHPALRCVLLGGGPVPPSLVQECLDRRIPVAPTYGLTEATSQVTTLPPADTARKPGSVGQPLMPVALRIAGDDGSECPPGEPGEIVIRGPTVTAGYLGRPGDTATALREGWFHTGDFGYLDADGHLYVIDRRDDVILTGGENVYPAEVEAALSAHADIREAAVFGVADPHWGQEVRAAVVLYEGRLFDAAGIEAFCRQRLAGYKVPRRIDVVAELPRNASGKVLRRELRRLFEAS